MPSIEYHVNKKDLWDISETIFLQVTSPNAESDPDFSVAYKKATVLINKIQNGRVTSDHEWLNVLEYYSKSLHSKHIVEAACNIVSCHFIFLGGFNNPAIANELGRKPDDHQFISPFMKRIALGEIPPLTESGKRMRNEYLIEHESTLLSCLRIMKESSEWNNLADFYLALRYLLGFIVNEYDDTLNRIIGVEMLYVFKALGNPYAAKLWGILVDL